VLFARTLTKDIFLIYDEFHRSFLPCNIIAKCDIYYDNSVSVILVLSVKMWLNVSVFHLVQYQQSSCLIVF